MNTPKINPDYALPEGLEIGMEGKSEIFGHVYLLGYQSEGFFFNLEDQDASTINNLMNFIRLANEDFEKAKNNAKSGIPDMFGRRLKYFAAERYHMRFFDDVQEDTYNDYVLINRDIHLHSNAYDFRGSIISHRKLKGIINEIKKGENRLYKQFDSLFLKNKKSRISA